MEYLFDVWPRIVPVLQSHYVMLFLDYDGTLTPIVKHPQLAHLSDSTKKVLAELSHEKRLKIVIVSGRSLADIKQCVGIQELSYVGNHGFEIEDSDLKYVYPDAERAES